MVLAIITLSVFAMKKKLLIALKSLKKLIKLTYNW